MKALPALAAARAGYDIVATDFDDDVIEILRVNARLNGLLEVHQPQPQPWLAQIVERNTTATGKSQWANARLWWQSPYAQRHRR